MSLPPTSTGVSSSVGDALHIDLNADQDAINLTNLGYKQEMKRNFSLFSVLSMAFTLTNSWFGISAAMVTGISSGGPVLLVYGIILVALVTSCAAISLSELASAMPVAGGQYFWANELAPKRYANFASYLTGWFAWAGSIFTTSSVTLAMGTAVMGLYQATHEDFVIETWHVLVAYQLFNVLAFFFNVHGKTLPRIATVTLWISLISFSVIVVAVPSAAPAHQRASFVFTKFMNKTGWKADGIAFIVGLMAPEWAFACLDAATHLAEEVRQPERRIPEAICGTVLIGFVTAWTFAISMMFSIQDLDAVVSTHTGVPIIEIFRQSFSLVGVCALETLIILTGTGCLIASHTWQCRLCWSFARDGGLPGYRLLKRVNSTLEVPLAAHICSTIIVGMVGCLYLASSAAFNSLVTGCIVLLYISYSIPVLCLLIKGRENIRHGPFWLGKFGLLANCVLLAWTAFILVFYSFPTFMPAKASNMNYISAVYIALVILVAMDWTFRGRHHFRGQEVRHEQAAEAERLRHHDNHEMLSQECSKHEGNTLQTSSGGPEAKVIAEDVSTTK